MTGTKNTELKHEDWDIKDLLKTTKDSTTAATSSEDEIARLLEEAKASLEVPTTKGKDEDIDGSKVDPEHEDEDKPEEDEEEEEEDELTQITRILNQARDAAALEAEEEKANPKAPSPIPSTPPLPYTSDTDLIMPPSPPKSTTQPSTTTEPITDDELSLRLLNLRRDMPTQSLPFHDAPKKDGTADESDDENWCTMCAMDAEFRCSGCDGEVYCENCLWESHQGPSAGWEEKRHKWTRMDRGKMVGIGG
ncbi:hypothetical protein BJ508DRAFT_121891 [Ascobolus immersus RN42]|uniref:Uncharacterized protein n=1 Tax=Ascobolus immersus RN42 TaxID=1160509 RepID=A0A3N4IRR6_ASCIM|nr:hypothetical protein BJ508DRAFT_121891 [Ascobolus immersus RN42]